MNCHATYQGNIGFVHATYVQQMYISKCQSNSLDVGCDVDVTVVSVTVVSVGVVVNVGVVSVTVVSVVVLGTAGNNMQKDIMQHDTMQDVPSVGMYSKLRLQSLKILEMATNIWIPRAGCKHSYR